VYAAGGDAIRLLTVVARVRPGSRTANVLSAIRREVAGMAPGNTVTASWWGEEIAGATAYSNPRFQAIVLGGFGVLALGLTAIGVFGIVAFLVAARTREMGIRLAIGASPGSLIRLIVGEALPPLAVGLAAGLLATRWLAGFAEAQLFDVDTRDPLTLGLAAATVVASALAAAYLPARRGARVDPVVVLRTE
jgi:putative ABC transport system permease protein